jgi:methylphosphotriester-DNA--protein-cysteine methyltransferase
LKKGEAGMKKYKNLIGLFLVIIFFLASIALAADYKYVGSKKSDKYHYPSCKWAQKIKPENLVTFTSAQEAIKAGYVPCKVCRPPTKDNKEEK